MNAKPTQRNKYSDLRRTPGRGPGWQAKAAKDLEYSPSYISRLQNGRVKSPAAEAALADWKKRNRIPA